MRLIEYLIKFSFLFGVSISSIFLLGPGLISQVYLQQRDNLVYDSITKFDLIFLNEHSEKYVKLKLKIGGHYEEKIYFLPDKQHLEIINFLRTKRIVSTELKDNEFVKVIPISIPREKLNEFNQVITQIDENHIEFLSIEDIVIIGKASTIKRNLALIIGVLIIVIGIIIAILGILVLISKISFYKKTGKLAPLPNSIDQMTNGVKVLFRINKPDKENSK